jgi:hypothetical protein
MTTNVSQQYTSSLNLSVTVRDGMVSRITTWVSGAPGTETHRDLFAGDPDRR